VIELSIDTQPDDETCGPTSLHAIYQYYGLDLPLEAVIASVKRSVSGGTLAPMLGQNALQQGFTSTIYVNNLTVFDPSWFVGDKADPDYLISKLSAQIKYKKSKALVQACHAYQDYLRLGGTLCFQTVTVQLLKDYFEQNIPILTGLSATYLYRCSREIYTKEGHAIYDDVRGTSCGHFVVLCGYDDANRHIVVADPHRENPLSHNNYYKVSSQRLINAIMLGVLTYDASLLIIHPKEVCYANDYGH